MARFWRKKKNRYFGLNRPFYKDNHASKACWPTTSRVKATNTSQSWHSRAGRVRIYSGQKNKNDKVFNIAVPFMPNSALNVGWLSVDTERMEGKGTGE